MFVVVRTGLHPYSWQAGADVGPSVEKALNARYMRNRELRAALPELPAVAPLVIWGEYWTKAPCVAPLPGLEPLPLFALSSRRWMKPLADVPDDTAWRVLLSCFAVVLGVVLRPLVALGYCLYYVFEGGFLGLLLLLSRLRIALLIPFSKLAWIAYPSMISVERRWLTRKLLSRELWRSDVSVLVVRELPLFGYVVTILGESSIRRHLLTRLEATVAATYWLSPIPEIPRLMDD